MSLARVDFYSECLGFNTTALVIIPDSVPNKRANVLYLLHGLSDNCTGWMRLTSIERYARARKMAVVMPEVQRSYYTDMAYGPKYFSYVAVELPKLMQKMFGFSDKQEKNYVAGLSMGGYGALKCALTYPQKYAGCAAFSSACDVKGNIEGGRYNGTDRLREFKALFGENLEVGDENDLFALMKKNADLGGKAKFFVTCGTDDSLYAQNVRFKEEMEKLPYELTYLEWKGDHTWDFWDKSIQLALELFIDKKKKLSV